MYVELEQNFKKKEKIAQDKKLQILQQIKKMNGPINFDELNAFQQEQT